jgi:anti-sigma regulatory factor (Ser/Thr protein kinase)
VNETTSRGPWIQEYPAEAVAVRDARRFVVESPAATTVDPNDLAMAVSELVSNAVLHARTPFEVRVESLDDGIRVEVLDRSPTMPVARRADPTTVTGRGLLIVQTVSRSWGTEACADGGKVVWFEMGSFA